MNLTKFLLTAYLAVFSVGSQALTVPYDGRIDLSIQTSSTDADGDELTYRYEIIDTDGTTVLDTLPGSSVTVGDTVLDAITSLPGFADTNTYSIRLVASDGTGETISPVKTFSVSVSPPPAWFVEGNGVTINCSGAAVGDNYTFTEGPYSGRTFTAVDNATLAGYDQTASVTPFEEACTSHVTSMNPSDSWGGGIFYNATINPDISHWDTSSVVGMQYMFSGASNFNQPVNFDTSSVTDMQYMFYDASSFNQPVNFDTSSVTTMESMFDGASSFNQPLNFDTSSVTTMQYMFYYASSFNQPLNFTDTSNVSNMESMFDGASNFNQPVNFDTSGVTNMAYMFYDASSFNQPVNFDTSSMTDIGGLFDGASSFNQPLSFTDTSSITRMDSMFSGASSFNQPLNFDTSSVQDMNHMFADASSFNQPLNFDTSSVTSMGSMFDGASSFSQDISDWCVTILSSKPTNFDDLAGFAGNSAIQPQWGTCP